jgi:hypothetical protein
MNGIPNDNAMMESEAQLAGQEEVYEQAVTSLYMQMYRDFKHVILGEYFCLDSLHTSGEIFEWHDETGCKGSIDEPLSKFIDMQFVSVEPEVIDDDDEEEEEE